MYCSEEENEEEQYNLLYNITDTGDSIINYCECGNVLLNMCYVCGYKKDTIEFEKGPSRSTQENYNIHHMPKYCRYNYIKSMLYRIKNIDSLTYEDEIYKSVIDAYNNNKSKLNITFRTFFFRLNIFKDEELPQFLYYMNKDKINIDNVKDALSFETIHKISLHYKLIHTDLPKGAKWSNRNIFIKFFYKDVYANIEPLLFSTESTTNKYKALYKL